MRSVHMEEIEAIQKRALCFMLTDSERSYKNLLKKSRNPSMNLRATRSLCIEIYKTIINLNPELMKNLFKVRKTNRAQREQYKLNLQISKSNQVSLGTKSLGIQEILQAFRCVIKFFWTGQNAVAISVLILIFNSHHISVQITLCMYQCIFYLEEIL